MCHVPVNPMLILMFAQGLADAVVPETEFIESATEPSSVCSEYREGYTIGFTGNEDVTPSIKSADACRDACTSSVNCCGYVFKSNGGYCYAKKTTASGTCQLTAGDATHGAALCTPATASN